MRVVWVIDAEHWPRALLRAELIERGYDAIGFMTVDDALRANPSSRWPDVIIVELKHVSQNEALRLFGANVPVIAITGLAAETWNLPFAAVLRRPVSIGELADKVATV